MGLPRSQTHSFASSNRKLPNSSCFFVIPGITRRYCNSVHIVGGSRQYSLPMMNGWQYWVYDCLIKGQLERSSTHEASLKPAADVPKWPFLLVEPDSGSCVTSVQWSLA